MGAPSHRGDHVDLSASTVHGTLVGKQVNHHYGPTPQALWGLPSPALGFSGRDREVRELLAMLGPDEQNEDHAGGVLVSAVSGMGGIGKTALAVVAGGRALSKGWFSCAVFVNLRGYDPNPVTPAQGLEAVLRAVGVDAQHIPTGLEERAALYRSKLVELAAAHGGPVLVVADNASSVEQANVLLPGKGGHRLLVTSRDPLDALHARRLGLEVLTVTESMRMMESVMAVTDSGDDRLETDPEAARAIAEACGGLPLALLVCVSLLRSEPDRPLTELAGELADPSTRLRALNDGYRSVTGLFELAVRVLPPAQERMFVLLGIAPGREITTSDAAILAGATPESARSTLRGLAQAQLVTRLRKSDRWWMHDLTHAFARHHAELRSHDKDSAEEQRVSLLRLLDHYTATVYQADVHQRALPGQSTPNRFSGREEAMTWLGEHYDTLIEAARTARRINHAPAATLLPLNLARYLNWERAFTDLVTVTTIACDTYRDLGDLRGEAHARNTLGIALREMSRYDDAIDAHQQARTTYQQLGDARNEAHSWNNLGLALCRVRRHTDAIDALTQARTIYQRLDDALSEAMAWNNLGTALREVRRHTDAIEAHGHARTTYLRLGDAYNAAHAAHNLGLTLYEVRRHGDAIEALTQACASYHRIGDAHSEATARVHLSSALSAMRRFTEAEQALRKAADLFGATNDLRERDQALRALETLRT